jgi:hypothetical protein
MFSAKDLDLHALGVLELAHPRTVSAYSCRYDGLRLLQQNGDRYILINENWDDQGGRVFLLTASA